MNTAVAFLLASALQHDHAAHGKETTLTALVVDTGCYVSHNTKGEKHTPCATACAKAGVPVALLEEGSGTLYLPIATDHKNPNARLMPFIEKRVKVTGSVVEKGGLKGLAVKTIEAAK